MHGTILEYSYIPGGKSQLVQGVKRGARPKNAVAGGNGSWIVREPAKVVLKVKDEHVKFDVIDVTKDVRRFCYTNNKCLTKARVNDICSKIINAEVELTGDGKSIMGLYTLLCD